MALFIYLLLSCFCILYCRCLFVLVFLFIFIFCLFLVFCFCFCFVFVFCFLFLFYDGIEEICFNNLGVSCKQCKNAWGDVSFRPHLANPLVRVPSVPPPWFYQHKILSVLLFIQFWAKKAKNNKKIKLKLFPVQTQWGGYMELFQSLFIFDVNMS